MKRIQSLGMLFVVGILWWGLVFPELCFLEGTYECVIPGNATENLSEEESEELELTDEEAFRKLLESGSGRIIVKSKMMRK